MVKMANHGSGRVRMEFTIPSRGLIGLRNEMLTETRGTIVMNSISDGYVAYQGEIPQRPSGALISDRSGTTTTYALNGLQDRGVLFIGEGTEVYEGMVIGEHSRPGRQLRARKEAHQHASLWFGRRAPAGSLQAVDPRAVNRIYC
jgi:GTP-binding protein